MYSDSSGEHIEYVVSVFPIHRCLGTRQEKISICSALLSQIIVEDGLINVIGLTSDHSPGLHITQGDDSQRRISTGLVSPLSMHSVSGLSETTASFAEEPPICRSTRRHRMERLW